MHFGNRSCLQPYYSHVEIISNFSFNWNEVKDFNNLFPDEWDYISLSGDNAITVDGNFATYPACGYSADLGIIC